MQQATQLETYKIAFEQLSRQTQGEFPSWLDGLRAAAIERFMEAGFPTTREEDWKYTSLAALAKSTFSLSAPGEAAIVHASDLPHSAWSAHRIVFVDGRFSPQLSNLAAVPAGVRVERLATALADHPDEVQPHFGRHADAQRDVLVALNTALFRDGVFIYVPAGVVVERPIDVVYVSTGKEQDFMVHPRCLIVAEENSTVGVVEQYLSLAPSAPDFTNAVTEIVVGANASVRHYKVQREAEDASHIATIQVSQERDSRYVSNAITLGAGLSRNDIHVILEGEGSDCTLDGVYLVGGKQHADTHSTIVHARPHCTSHEQYKGLLAGKSVGVFNGRVIVPADAQKTSAEQSNTNLLLSDDAVINTKPQLEIFADDVRCSHGATVGQLDEDVVFYLQARGLNQQAARRLLTGAFASEIIERITIEDLRDELLAQVREWLPATETKG